MSRAVNFQTSGLILTNLNPTFHQVKLENYGINVTPDKHSSRAIVAS